MRTTEHVGSVVAVKGSRAVIELQTPEACSRMRCACCGVASTGARTIEVPRGDLEEGERVCVSVPLYAGYLSTLVVFVLPIVLALAGGAVGWVLEGRTTAHDLSIIVGGLCGFAVAVAVAALVNRRLSTGANLEVHRLDGRKTQ